VAGDDRLTQALRALDAASRDGLISEWRRLYKSDPPRYASREFLMRAVAYALQEQAHGGLSTAARRALLAIAKGGPVPARALPIRIKPGTRLMRAWRGTTQEVIVTDQGFVWDGTTYRSLSAIALAITGAKWNGYRFFGLAKARRAADG
jgi:hypothetical protein